MKFDKSSRVVKSWKLSASIITPYLSSNSPISNIWAIESKFRSFRSVCKCLGINSGCTGFVEAYELVSLYFSQNISSKALIITYDTYSHFLNHEDISTRALFSDGASISLIDKDENHHKIIDSKVSTATNSTESLTFKKETNRIVMKGSEVFLFGLKHVKKDLQNMILKYPESLVILHQAGKVMLDGLKKVVGEEASVPCNYSEYGNLVSSSIPFLLSENIKEFNNSNSIIMSGFGVGLSSHTLVLKKDWLWQLVYWTLKKKIKIYV